jgi:hypothetical protein
MKSWVKALLAALTLISLSAHDIITTNLTYTRDVSRLVARRCVSCHGAGSSIPLTTYEQTRPWAVAIKEQVLSRRMPPWGAVKGFGHFSPDNGLSQEEMMVIAAWVVGGAPRGDPAFLPRMAPGNDVLKAPLALQDALVVRNRLKVQRPLLVAGIRPIAAGIVDSAKIIASFADGHVEPLLWLFQYDSAGNKIFAFRQPMALARGTVVESSTPLRFALEVVDAK